MLSLVSFFLIFVVIRSQEPDEPPPGVERNLLNSKSMRDKFRAKAFELEKEREATNRLLKIEQEKRDRAYRRKLVRMSPEDQEKRKKPGGLKELQDERIARYKIGPTTMTKEELSKCNGEFPDMPVLLSCKGRIYDVTASNSIKIDGAYGFFAGKDRSRAYALSNFAHENLIEEDNLDGLTPENLERLDKWVQYFEGREDYYYVGTLSDYKYPGSTGKGECSAEKSTPWIK